MRKLFLQRPFGALALIGIVVLAIGATAAAATTVVVTQNSASWHSTDIRAGGTVMFTEAYGAPAGLGSGSLELKTPPSTDSKADYFTFEHAGTPLAAVTD